MKNDLKQQDWYQEKYGERDAAEDAKQRLDDLALGSVVIVAVVTVLWMLGV